MKITGYDLHRIQLPLPRPIGDSQVCYREMGVVVLELRAGGGLTGVGFQARLGSPWPPFGALLSSFEAGPWRRIAGTEASTCAPAGPEPDAEREPPAAQAFEHARWDLAAKVRGVPLYRLLGGTSPRVRAYASTLDYHLPDDAFRDRLAEFKAKGFRAVKIKVGHPDVAWDLRRLRIAREVFGPDAALMADANEAWSADEAICRAGAYRDAGFALAWIEDPLKRDDFEGYARLRAAAPFVPVHAGEYLDLEGKRKLLEAGGGGILHVHGLFSAAREAARWARERGLPVAVGNMPLEVGVHLAASLPGCLTMEFSDLAWNGLAREPVRFENGFAIAPDRPGHGIELDREALTRCTCPA